MPEQSPAPAVRQDAQPFITEAGLPAFPVDALPAAARAFCVSLAEELEVPVDLPACLCLGALASSVMGKLRVQMTPSWREPLNLYLAIALEPGERKSPALRRCFAPLYEREKELRVTWDQERKRIEAENKDRDKSEREKVPAMPRLFADDATPEALAVLLAKHGERLTIAADEGTTFEHACGMYSKAPNTRVFLSAYDGGRYAVDRKLGDPLFLRAPLVTLAMAVQPSVIRSLAKRPELRGRGLLSRFLYSFPRSKIGGRTFGSLRTDGPRALMPRETREAWHDLVLGLARLEPPPGDEDAAVMVSNAALERFRQLLLALEPHRAPGGALSGVRDWAGKLEGMTVRIAGLLHVAEHGGPGTSPITAQTMERAIAVMRYFTAHARHCLEVEMSRTDGEQAGLRLWELIERRGWRSFPTGQVQQFARWLRDPGDATRALEGLEARGLITRDRKHKGKGARWLVPEAPARPAPLAGDDPAGAPSDPPPSSDDWPMSEGEPRPYDA